MFLIFLIVIWASLSTADEATCAKHCGGVGDDCSPTNSSLPCKIGLSCDPKTSKCVGNAALYAVPKEAVTCNATAQCRAAWPMAGANFVCSNKTNTCINLYFPNDQCSSDDECAPLIGGRCSDGVCEGAKVGEACVASVGDEGDGTALLCGDARDFCHETTKLCVKRIATSSPCHVNGSTAPCVQTATCSSDKKCLELFSQGEGAECVDVDGTRDASLCKVKNLLCQYDNLANTSSKATCKSVPEFKPRVECEVAKAAEQCQSPWESVPPIAQCQCNHNDGKYECLSSDPAWHASNYACREEKWALKKCAVEHSCASTIESMSLKAIFNAGDSHLCAHKHCKLEQARVAACMCRELQNLEPSECVDASEIAKYYTICFVWEAWMIILIVLAGVFTCCCGAILAVWYRNKRKRRLYTTL